MVDDTLIFKVCKDFDLPFDLIKAIVEVESQGDPLAIRYEPFYRWIKDEIVRKSAAENSLTYETELMLSKCSIGPMQIMGFVAREEHNFKGNLLLLTKPEIGMRFGCKHVRKLWDRYNGYQEYVIAAYNGGHGAVTSRTTKGVYHNQRYVSLVLEKQKIISSLQKSN